MALLVGVILALVLAIFASVVGFDRDRSYYASVLAVIALLYGLFAVMSGSRSTLLLEGIGITASLVERSVRRSRLLHGSNLNLRNIPCVTPPCRHLS